MSEGDQDISGAQLSCPVCGSHRLTPRQEHLAPDIAKPFTLYACDGCGVQHWRPLEHPGAAYYEEEKVAIYRALHDGGKTPDDPRFARFFREFGDLRGIRALDLGCSGGAFLARLEAAGNEVWGIDIDDNALEVARARGLSNVHRLGVTDFVRKAQNEGLRFQLITAFDVIEHLTDPVATLRELSTILEPGGKLVGTVPNRNRLLVNQMPIDFPPHPFFRFDSRSLRATLTRAGVAPLRIDTFQYNYATMAALDLALKSLPRRQKAPPQNHAATPNTPAAGPRQSPLSRAKQGIAQAYAWLSTPLSYAIELPRRRGFKLYFVAEKS